METTNKNFFETITEMQKKVVENFNETTEKMQKNFFGNNYMDSDPFKKWYDSQMSFFTQNHDKKGGNDPLNFFNSWIEGQMEFSKNWMAHNQKVFHTMGKDMNTNPQMEMYHNWMDTMSKTYNEMIKNFSPKNDSFTSFSGLFNNSQNYLKMFELWMPMLNSLKEKSFTPDLFKNMFSPQIFKDLMDNAFNMQPEYVRNYTESFNNTWKENMEALTSQGKSYYDQFSRHMHKNLADGNNYIEQMNAYYHNLSDSMNKAFSPVMKLMSPGTQKDQINMMNEISEEFNKYSMLASKMQYMMYVTGVKAMEEVAESVYDKMNKGEDMSNFLNIYQEWLNINDKNFINLFDSEEYSKMQSELHASDMRMKKNINTQLEKSFAHLPLINRSEMDALYKTIYELKKQITDLLRNSKTPATAPAAEVTPEPAKAQAKTAAKKA